jgi:glutathione S-transferase
MLCGAMILYHFVTSPFARRVRLALHAKGMAAELRDPRADARHWPDLHGLNPCRTVPTLVDGELVLTDSLAILAHLEAKAPSPALWSPPGGLAAMLEIVRLADRALEQFIDLGIRYHPVREHPAFAQVKESLFARAQGALDRVGGLVAARADAPFLVGDQWSLADIAVVTTGLWLEGLPARAATFAPAKQILDLGWKVPASIATWTNARKTRADVASLL